MDSMEFNKIAAAVLTAGIAFAGLGIVADNLSHPDKLTHTVLDIKVPETSTTGAPAAPVGPAPIEPLMVSAKAEDGQAYTKKICVACHNFNEGGANKVGPDLYGVVGRERASAPGFEYSAALKSHPGKWDYDSLNEWLYKPAAFAKGTKMAYAGLSDDKLRAAVIDYLRSLSANPEPMPTEAQIKAAEAKAAPKPSAAAAPAAGGSAEAALPAIGPLLASADPAAGQAYTKKICVACHNFAEGAGAKMGPDLYGVVGRERASVPGYEYSAALKSHPGKWTYDTLNEWLYKPSAFAHGTKMAYAGLSDNKLRADVIDYLHTLSHDPEPLPAASAASGPKPSGEAAKGSGSSGGADAPAGEATQAGPNQNQPTDAQTKQAQPPQAHAATPTQPGTPAAQGKPN